MFIIIYFFQFDVYVYVPLFFLSIRVLFVFLFDKMSCALDSLFTFIFNPLKMMCKKNLCALSTFLGVPVNMTLGIFHERSVIVVILQTYIT